MNRPLLLVLAIGLLSGLGFVVTRHAVQAQGVQVQPARPQIAQPLCPNPIVREPVLLYECAGSTLLGPTLLGLTVYNDGTVAVFKREPNLPGPIMIFNNGEADWNTISVNRVRMLMNALINAGAATLCDNPTLITDVPICTVTVMRRPGTDARAHTFSYYGSGLGQHAVVDSIIRNFITTEFPNF